jgi:alpha-beta hydrolase superfamily lysophospholipase
VEELHTLLTEGEIDRPYVLVAHSTGGVCVRGYAFEYPEEVVGPVLGHIPLVVLSAVRP